MAKIMDNGSKPFLSDIFVRSVPSFLFYVILVEWMTAYNRKKKEGKQAQR